MEQIIEQIRKIGGVKIVKPVGKDMVVVVFEAEKKNPIFVTEDGVEYFKNTCRCWWVDLRDFRVGVQPYIGSNLYEQHCEFKFFSTKQAAEAYIAEQNKSTSLKPEELVDGEIYVQKHENGDVFPFRFKDYKFESQLNYYSMATCGKPFWDDWCASGDDEITIRTATILEKQQLIKAEIEHDFYFELRTQIK